MPSGRSMMDNKLDYQVPIVQDLINTKNKKMKKRYSDIKTMFKQMLDQKHHSSQNNMDSPKTYNLYTIVTDNKRDAQFEGEHYIKLVVCGISNMISAHQNSMNFSPIQIYKETLLLTKRISITTSICVSMRWIYPKKIYFLLTSISK